jgi:hypothetical protein
MTVTINSACYIDEFVEALGAVSFLDVSVLAFVLREVNLTRYVDVVIGEPIHFLAFEALKSDESTFNAF